MVWDNRTLNFMLHCLLLCNYLWNCKVIAGDKILVQISVLMKINLFIQTDRKSHEQLNNYNFFRQNSITISLESIYN